MWAWQTHAPLLPSLTSLFYWDPFLWSLRLFRDLETISTIGDIMNMWCPPSLKCLKRSFVAPNLAYFIHKRTQMDSSLFRTYQGKTYEPAFLFYMRKLFSCGKKKCGFATLNQRRIKQGDNGRRLEQWLACQTGRYDIKITPQTGIKTSCGSDEGRANQLSPIWALKRLFLVETVIQSNPTA